jgi:hypothetical protein
MGTVVLIRGVLRGMEHETGCEVLVRKHSIESGSPRYSEGFVLNAPVDLPEGEYTVTFDGHSLHAVSQHGIWLTSTDIVRIVA